MYILVFSISRTKNCKMATNEEDFVVIEAKPFAKQQQELSKKVYNLQNAFNIAYFNKQICQQRFDLQDDETKRLLQCDESSETAIPLYLFAYDKLLEATNKVNTIRDELKAARTELYLLNESISKKSQLSEFMFNLASTTAAAFGKFASYLTKSPPAFQEWNFTVQNDNCEGECEEEWMCVN